MRVVALLVTALLAGCVEGLLMEGDLTTTRFACNVLQADEVTVEVRVDAPGDPAPAVEVLVLELARVTGLDPSRFDRRYVEGVVETGERTQEAHLVIWWTALNTTGRQLGPGIVAVSVPHIQAAGERLGDLDGAAATVVLHHVGHALGVVNRGIPVSDPRIETRENPQHHDPDDTVMNVNAHSADTLRIHTSYPDDIVKDWRSAVCS